MAASPEETSVSQGGAFQQRPADPGSLLAACGVCVWLCVARRVVVEVSTANEREKSRLLLLAASKGQCRNTRAYDLPLILPNVRLAPVTEL